MAEDLDILNDYNRSRRCVDKGSICHAAESSMYFGRDGVVSACCYSRSSPLGRYPDQSLEEIWSGIQAKSMRAALRRNELPAGCELCADQFYARNFSGFLAQQFDWNARPLRAWGLMSRSRRQPVRFDFELSNKCNLECTMCSGFFSSSIRANRESLPPLPQIYDEGFVQQLVPFLPHLTNANFYGGEPFLVDLYYDIWSQLIETNPKCVVSITTNGTVYTSKVKRVMEKLNCQVIVSLDSVTKATYEAIRKNATLEGTLRNLQAFSAINRLKGRSLTLAICPMISNCREIPGLVAFANERDMRIFFHTVVFPAAQSIKTLPLAVQREILDLYKCSPQPHTETESANFKALEGLCRQIEFWMKEGPPAARRPLERRCAELLAGGAVSGSVACVLADLAGNTERGAGHIEEADPVHELKGYYRAIWSVGGMLQSSGMLANLHFDPDHLQVFLLHLENRLGPEQARRLWLESRRFPRQMLSFCGSLSAEKLIALVESHLAPTGLADASIDS